MFERNLGGSDNWGEVKELVPPNEPDNSPPSGVAIDGVTIAMGVESENGRLGAVYIYGRNVGGANNWRLVTRLEDPDGQHG